jgi:CDP-glucose 4,6-dehydratase
MADPSFWAGRRVFVTGHTGFKGTWLCAWLTRMRADVRGYALAPSTNPNLAELIGIESRLDAIRADIRDPSTLQSALSAFAPDVVLHLAAQALVRRGYTAPAETFATNVMGTLHVLEAVRRAPSVRVALVVTSDKVYANHESATPYDEQDPLGGHDPYSASKACAELMASCWRRGYALPSIVTARAGNVIGGGDWAPDRLVPDCMRALAAQQPISLRSPQATRPWQHVLDPLNGYLMLAEHVWCAGIGAAEAWNFGPAPSDIRTVADIVAALGGCWTPSPCEGPREAGHLAVDSAKAHARLGWRPRLAIDDALAWTEAWYRRHREGEDARGLVDEQIARFEALA